MKVSVNVNDLNRMLKTAGKFIDRTGPLAGKIALSVHDGIFETIVVAFSVELQLSTDAGDVYNDDFERVPAENGFCVVRAKDLAPLKNVGKGSEIVIEAQKDVVHVATSDFAFDVPTACDPTEFPDISLQLNGDPAETLEIVPDDCGCFKFIVPALSPDTDRPEFTGAVLRDGAIIATDGHRLHHCPLPALFGTGGFVGIISPKLLNFIADGHAGTLTEYRERSGKTKIQAVATWHVLEAPGVCIKSRPIKGSFPDFSRVLPSYRSNEVVDIDTEQWTGAIKQLSAGWKDSSVLIRNKPADRAVDKCVELKCQRLFCSDKKKNAEPPRTKTIPMSHIPNLPVCLNSRYVLDALKNCKNSVATFCCIDPDSPVWIGEWSPAAFGRGAIIMPMQL